MLEKLNLFYVTSLITLVLLMGNMDGSVIKEKLFSDAGVIFLF